MKFLSLFIFIITILSSCAQVESAKNYCDEKVACKNGEICINNECTSSSLPCSPTNPTGSCSENQFCNDGVCRTKNSCNPNPCKELNQNICSADGDSYTCSCNDGFILINNICAIEENNPCNPNPCQIQNKTVCTVQGTVFKCNCNSGFIEDSYGNCLPANPCNPNPCTNENQNICVPDEGSYNCQCNAGFIDDGLGGCKQEGANPCDPNPCNQTNQTVCVVESDSFRCDCDAGYFKNENNLCIAGCFQDSECSPYQNCNLTTNSCGTNGLNCSLFGFDCDSTYACYTFSEISSTACAKKGIKTLGVQCNQENECMDGFICTSDSTGVKKCQMPCRPSIGILNNTDCPQYNKCVKKTEFSDIGCCVFDQTLVPMGSSCSSASECPPNSICTGFTNSADIDFCIASCNDKAEGEVNSSLYQNWVMCVQFGDGKYWMATCNTHSDCGDSNIVCRDNYSDEPYNNINYCMAKPIGYGCNKANTTFCGVGKGCYNWDESNTYCRTAGTVPIGGNCETALCVPGSECWILSGVATCLKLCDTSNPCSDGKTCSELSEGNYGYCN